LEHELALYALDEIDRIIDRFGEQVLAAVG
jgi:hypothetical protein